jgi:hypothetical protein
MLFGMSITPQLMVFGGAFLFLLLALQVLVGLRIIRIGKPKTHMRSHRLLGYALLAVALVHGFLGIMYGLGLTIP